VAWTSTPLSLRLHLGRPGTHPPGSKQFSIARELPVSPLFRSWEQQATLMIEQGFNIATAVRDAKNKNIRVLNAVDNDIAINRIAASARS